MTTPSLKDQIAAMVNTPREPPVIYIFPDTDEARRIYEDRLRRFNQVWFPERTP